MDGMSNHVLDMHTIAGYGGAWRACPGVNDRHFVHLKRLHIHGCFKCSENKSSVTIALKLKFFLQSDAVERTVTSHAM